MGRPAPGWPKALGKARRAAQAGRLGAPVIPGNCTLVIDQGTSATSGPMAVSGVAMITSLATDCS
jgi:hypothetical protein